MTRFHFQGTLDKNWASPARQVRVASGDLASERPALPTHGASSVRAGRGGVVRTRLLSAGFTLIELVIVIAVIAILAALLIPTILGQAERGRASRALADVKTLGKAIAVMRTDTASSAAACLTVTTNLFLSASPPACGSTLPLCSQVPAPGLSCWSGPYIREIVPDSWGNDYTVTEDPETYFVTVTSNGPDGVNGTSDDLTYFF